MLIDNILGSSADLALVGTCRHQDAANSQNLSLTQHCCLATSGTDRHCQASFFNGINLTAIEAYPSACKRSETIQALRRPYPALSHADCEDALTCALVASLFAEKPSSLIAT